MTKRKSIPSVQSGIPRLGACPKGWRTVKFGDVLKEVTRAAKLESDREYQLVVAKRSRGGIAERECLKGSKILTKTQFYLESGDFLISRRQIVHGACGIVPENLSGAIVSNEYTVLHPTDELDLQYLWYLAHTIYFQQTCFHSSVGVDVEKMIFRLSHWMNRKINLPPLSEQKKIAEILSTWDRSIELSLKEKETNRYITRYISQKIFSTNRRVALKKLLRSNIEYGANASSVEYVKGYTPRYIRITDISDNGVLEQNKIVGIVPKEAEKYILDPGDILVARSGNTVGKSYLHLCTERSAFAGYLLRLRADDNQVSPGYLFHYLQSNFFKSWVKKKLRAGAQPNINAEEYGEHQVPIIDRHLQDRSVKILDNSTAITILNSRKASLLELQRSALMQLLLSGKVRSTI